MKIPFLSRLFQSRAGPQNAFWASPFAMAGLFVPFVVK